MDMRAGAVAALVVLCSSCAVHGLALKEDRRLDITAPGDRSTVSLPVEITWTGSAQPASFGVFVDAAPQRPGQTLDAPFRGSRDCLRACLDRAYLANRNVFATTAPHVTVRHLNKAPSGQTEHFHEVTIVLLDAGGRRIGEGAWSVRFRLRSEG